MQARAAAAPVDAAAGTVDDSAPDAGTSRQSSTPSSRRRPVARPIVLSRDEEYAFIKQDMRRLVVTAAVLFLVMIALLFLID